MEIFLTCVIAFNGVMGVVVTREIHDRTRNEKWVIVETMAGSDGFDIKDLEPIACSKMDIDKFKNKEYILDLLFQATD